MDSATTSMNKLTAHGHVVHYSDPSDHGARHLAYKLSFSEAKALFDHAKRTRKPVDFEDRHGRNYVLAYDSGGSYRVEPRAH